MASEGRLEIHRRSEDSREACFLVLCRRSIARAPERQLRLDG